MLRSLPAEPVRWEKWAAIAVLAGMILAFGAISDAHAYLKAGPAGYGHWLQGAIAPLDGGGAFAAPAAAYSMRRLKSTYAGPAIRLRRASDNAEADIGFLGFTGFTGAPIDTAAANAHCAATSCTLVTWYDQSGNARHGTQATATAQPSYNGNCGNGLPCVQTSIESAPLLATASFTPTLPVSIGAVAKRDAVSASYCHLIGTNVTAGNDIFINSGTSEWALTDGASYLVPPAPDGSWHAAAGVINGAGSVIRLDGAETTGSAAGNVTAGSIWLSRKTGATSVCQETEAILWSGYALTAPERSALVNNQRSFWGF